MIKRLLSKHFPVITVSEFRTTKCCLHCGKVLYHPKSCEKYIGRDGKVHQKVNNSVSYCKETDHHWFVNRDDDAARKIGYLFLMRLSGLAGPQLGAWSRSVKLKDLSRRTWGEMESFVVQNLVGDLVKRVEH